MGREDLKLYGSLKCSSSLIPSSDSVHICLAAISFAFWESPTPTPSPTPVYLFCSAQQLQFEYPLHAASKALCQADRATINNAHSCPQESKVQKRQAWKQVITIQTIHPWKLHSQAMQQTVSCLLIYGVLQSFIPNWMAGSIRAGGIFGFSCFVIELYKMTNQRRLGVSGFEIK